MKSISIIRRRMTGVLISIAAVALLTSTAAASKLEELKEQGSIRVGYANEAPFAYVTPDGQLTGEAPEIAKIILERMGIPKIEGVLTEFGSLIPGLKAGRFDMIAAGMFVTPKRCEQIAFSEPSYGLGQSMIVKEGNPKGLKTYEDIANNPDATLGVMAGAIEKTYAKQAGVPEERISTFPDGPSGLAAVRTGRVDAFGLTSLSIATLLAKAGEAPGVEATESFGEVAGESIKGHGAFGFHPENKDLLEEFNKQLTEFIGTEEHLKLVAPFGFTKEDLPVKTTAELCASE